MNNFTLPTLENLVPMFQNNADGPRFHANWSWVKASGGNKVLRQLKVIDRLGQGYFSRVVIIERDDLREDKPVKFAAKVVGKKEDPMGYKWQQVEARDAEEFAINEARLLIKLRHKNVIMCYGAFENDDLWVIVLEYAQGKELYDRIYRITNLTEKVLVHYIRQMVDAISYLHSQYIIHRDIKPENFLIKNAYDSSTPWDKDRIILSDFGFAICTPTLKAERRCGSPMFAAPEVFKLDNGDQYTEKIDIWSLGVSTYELLTGYDVYRRIPEKVIPPKSRNVEYDVAMSITNEHIKKYVIERENIIISKNGQEFLSQCLDVNHKTRKAAKELQEESKWLKNCNGTYWSFNAKKAWKRNLTAVRELNKTIGSKDTKHSRQDETSKQNTYPHQGDADRKLHDSSPKGKSTKANKKHDNDVGTRKDRKSRQ